MFLNFKTWKKIFLEAVERFGEDEGSRFAASLAYSSIFSLAPLLVIATGLAGIIFGTTNAESQILQQVQGFLGEEGTIFVKGSLEETQNAKVGSGVTFVGVLLLLVGVASVFKELKDALNRIFDISGKRSGFASFVMKNIFSFGMVLATGFLLLVSLVLSLVLSALGKYFSDTLSLPVGFWESINFIFSFALTAGIFSLLYRYVPDRRTPWHDALFGGIVTALLFTIGKTLIGLYLGRSGIASAYGAAGSVVLILLWVYYSSQIVIFGGELAASYAAHAGRGVHRARLYTPPAGEKASHSTGAKSSKGLGRSLVSMAFLFILRRILKRIFGKF